MLVSFASPLPSLERLKLKGRLQEIPTWVGKCVNLVKVDLKYCDLKDLKALAELPSLIQLRLDGDAYVAEKLVFCKDAFQKLRILHLTENHPLIREVTFEENASPNMEKISIDAFKLTSGINGIKHLPNIKEISLNLFELAMVDIREEVNTHPNHPVLQIKRLEVEWKLVKDEKSEETVKATESISQAGDNSQP
ncbi:unnamed protein product [Urochloa humidicola]